MKLYSWTDEVNMLFSGKNKIAWSIHICTDTRTRAVSISADKKLRSIFVSTDENTP